MLKRHLCPQCRVDLQLTPPTATRNRWYKLVRRSTFDCPACGARLERRFSEIDLGFATALSGGMASAMWGGAGKPLLLAVVLAFGMRLAIAQLCSVYVSAKKQT